VQATENWAALVGVNGWLRDRQRHEAVAKITALVEGIDELDGHDVEVTPVVGVVESIRQKVAGVVGTPSHNTTHRAFNRMNRRKVVIKVLTNQLRFRAPARFDHTDVDRRALYLQARGVVEDAIANGLDIEDFSRRPSEDDTYDDDIPMRKVKIRPNEADFYRRAISAAYYMKDEDDVLFDMLAGPGGAKRA